MKKITIACIGDSLTEGDYGIPGKSGIANIHEENYPYFLSKLTKCEVKNFGYCGYRSTQILDLFKKGTINVTGCDLILIMLGTNGGQTESCNSEEDLAYIEIVNLCKKQSSAAKIYLIAPPYCSVNPKWSNCGMLDKVINANKFLANIAPKLGLPLIDLLANKTFCEENIEKYQGNDGLHFIEEGYKELANIIYSFIKKDIK